MIISDSERYPSRGKFAAQIRHFRLQIEQALDARDWVTLGQLDRTLFAELPALQRVPKTDEVRQELKRLNDTYTRMIAGCELEKQRTQQQLSHQVQHREGVMAYLQHSKS
ncbi:hypothetical protein VP758_005230 [Vibrio harveyi]|nr:hypothetical protein [Vibrio harveyi]